VRPARAVNCLSAALQLGFHLGHQWTDWDVHDLRLIAAEFPDVFDAAYPRCHKARVAARNISCRLGG
jgi:hypothetical protein